MLPLILYQLELQRIFLLLYCIQNTLYSNTFKLFCPKKLFRIEKKLFHKTYSIQRHFKNFISFSNTN